MNGYRKDNCFENCPGSSGENEYRVLVCSVVPLKQSKQEKTDAFVEFVDSQFRINQLLASSSKTPRGGV
jgi:hypothetical protein